MSRVVMLAILLGWLLVPIGTSAANLQISDDRAFDLPAVVPNLDELSAAGLDGYTLTSTGFFSLENDAAYLADVLFVDPVELEGLFFDTGREASYLGTLSRLTDPEDPASEIDREIQISIFSFADEVGAAEAYAFLSNEENDPGAEDETGGGTFGEESELTRRSIDPSAGSGVPVQELELQFYTDRLVVAVSSYAYGEDADEPSVEEMDVIGALVEERVGAVLAGDTPGLTRLVPLFEPVEGSVPYVAYWKRDGAAVPFNRETLTETEARVDGYGAAIDYLSFQQQILYGSDALDDDFLFNNNLLTFASAADAIDFVESTAERYEASDGNADFSVIDDAPEFGEASLVLNRTTNLNGAEWTRYQVSFAVGNIVSVFWVAQFTPDIVVPVEPLYELAEAQEECLANDGCAEWISVPDGIVDPGVISNDDAADDGGETTDADTGDAGDSDSADSDEGGFDIGRADDEETPEADDIDEETPVANDDDEAPTGDEITYDSPQYGYELTYNPQEWEVFAEDPDPDDAYDRITLSPTTGIDGIVTVVGDPDYDAEEMTDCVSDYAGGLEQDDAVSDLAELDGGETDDSAWVAYSYVLETEDGEIDAVRYIECRALDNVTIVVLQSSADADYEDLSDLREELLEGLDG